MLWKKDSGWFTDKCILSPVDFKITLSGEKESNLIVKVYLERGNTKLSGHGDDHGIIYV